MAGNNITRKVWWPPPERSGAASCTSHWCSSYQPLLLESSDDAIGEIWCVVPASVSSLEYTLSSSAPTVPHTGEFQCLVAFSPPMQPSMELSSGATRKLRVHYSAATLDWRVSVVTNNHQWASRSLRSLIQASRTRCLGVHMSYKVFNIDGHWSSFRCWSADLHIALSMSILSSIWTKHCILAKSLVQMIMFVNQLPKSLMAQAHVSFSLHLENRIESSHPTLFINLFSNQMNPNIIAEDFCLKRIERC